MTHYYFCYHLGMGSTKIGLMTDYTQQVIFTTSDPSLVMTFDSSMGLHSVWQLRYATAEVSAFPCQSLSYIE